MNDVEAISVAQALRGGPATLDALSVRLGGGVDRDALLWAIGDARDRGWLSGGEALDCGPDGLCGTSAPPIYTLTDAGRMRLRQPEVSRAAAQPPASRRSATDIR